jgi:predicted metal-dependent enzyme (double-stranded beta helix superfamily)
MNMHNSIEEFGLACHAAIKAKPGPAGRTAICAMLREVLLNTTLMNQCFDDHTPERKLLYQDPELGFCVLAHNYQGAKESPPHDHGPSWAIYGQVSGETKMFDWELVSPAGPGVTGKVKHKKDYVLKPGIAHVYNEGDLHSPSRAGATRLIRIEGTNMEHVTRYRYEAVDAA